MRVRLNNGDNVKKSLKFFKHFFMQINKKQAYLDLGTLI